MQSGIDRDNVGAVGTAGAAGTADAVGTVGAFGAVGAAGVVAKGWAGTPKPPDAAEHGSEQELLWVPAVSIIPTHLTRKLCVAYHVGATRGRVLYSRDVPKNQQAAARAHRGFLLAAKKERLYMAQQMQGGGVASAARSPLSGAGHDVNTHTAANDGLASTTTLPGEIA